MKQLHRRACIFLLLPLGIALLVGVPYVGSGLLARAVTRGPAWWDWAIWVSVAALVLVPPLWVYWLSLRLSRALAQTAEVAKRVAAGDFSRKLADWAAETSEMSLLEQSINAAAIHLQQRLSELSVEKARLEAILQNMVDGVLLVDSRRRLVLVNPAAEAMFGIRADEVLGKDHLAVTHHFDLDEKMLQVLQDGQTCSLEIRRARPQEEILEARLAPSGYGTEEQGVLVVLRNVTRARQLEKMRTEFVANVTHELRTPLTAIQGFAETLLDGALDDPDAARHFVGIIKQESESLARLIEDLLDLSHIESGKWKMYREPIQVAHLVQETVERMGPQAQEKGITLEVHVPAELPEITGDPRRLSQVLLNLMSNALKYTPSGGTVSVRAWEEDRWVRVSVADTGVGIPKADLPRVFERFYRVDKARSRATGGTGLGLSIAKHIVEAHGGSITVESDVGQGATFTFSLPKS